MKKISVLAISLLMFSLASYSQDDDFKTIFNADEFRISGFGGPFMNFTKISGEFGHMMGGGGGVLLGDFFFGGYGLGLTNAIRDVNNPNHQIEFGHGGFWLGYSALGKNAIHPCLHTFIGWGGISITDDYVSIDQDNVFVIEPTLEIEMNFSRFFRMGVGANYRIVSSVDLPGYDENDFSGPGVFLSFKFGWF